MKDEFYSELKDELFRLKISHSNRMDDIEESIEEMFEEESEVSADYITSYLLQLYDEGKVNFSDMIENLMCMLFAVSKSRAMSNIEFMMFTTEMNMRYRDFLSRMEDE